MEWTEASFPSHVGFTRAIQHARPSHTVCLLARFHPATEATKKQPAREAFVEVIPSLPVRISTEDPDELRRIGGHAPRGGPRGREPGRATAHPSLFDEVA